MLNRPDFSQRKSLQPAGPRFLKCRARHARHTSRAARSRTRPRARIDLALFSLHGDVSHSSSGLLELPVFARALACSASNAGLESRHSRAHLASQSPTNLAGAAHIEYRNFFAGMFANHLYSNLASRIRGLESDIGAESALDRGRLIVSQISRFGRAESIINRPRRSCTIYSYFIRCFWSFSLMLCVFSFISLILLERQVTWRLTTRPPALSGIRVLHRKPMIIRRAHRIFEKQLPLPRHTS